MMFMMIGFTHHEQDETDNQRHHHQNSHHTIIAIIVIIYAYLWIIYNWRNDQVDADDQHNHRDDDWALKI